MCASMMSEHLAVHWQSARVVCAQQYTSEIYSARSRLKNPTMLYQNGPKFYNPMSDFIDVETRPIKISHFYLVPRRFY